MKFVVQDIKQAAARGNNAELSVCGVKGFKRVAKLVNLLLRTGRLYSQTASYVYEVKTQELDTYLAIYYQRMNCVPEVLLMSPASWNKFIMESHPMSYPENFGVGFTYRGIKIILKRELEKGVVALSSKELKDIY